MDVERHAAQTGTMEDATFRFTLATALESALCYLGGLDRAPIAVSVDLGTLRNRLAKVLEDGGRPAQEVIKDLVKDVEGSILGSTSGRFFGWVIGGSLPSALAADWLTATWDQNAALSTLYRHLAPIANTWYGRMGLDVRFPPTHAEFISRCHEAGQTRPTPLLLQYGADDYNCLHQDLYGEHVFPLQVAILLSNPIEDFEGGEFVLTEQRPRMQSRVDVVPLAQGDAVVFAVNGRPVRGSRGDYRVHMRHGVSTIRKGHRHTLGIIFHDAT
jgi:hypothetical protein